MSRRGFRSRLACPRAQALLCGQAPAWSGFKDHAVDSHITISCLHTALEEAMARSLGPLLFQRSCHLPTALTWVEQPRVASQPGLAALAALASSGRIAA